MFYCDSPNGSCATEVMQLLYSNTIDYNHIFNTNLVGVYMIIWYAQSEYLQVCVCVVAAVMRRYMYM